MISETVRVVVVEVTVVVVMGKPQLVASYYRHWFLFSPLAASDSLLTPNHLRVSPWIAKDCHHHH